MIAVNELFGLVLHTAEVYEQVVNVGIIKLLFHYLSLNDCPLLIFN